MKTKVLLLIFAALLAVACSQKSDLEKHQIRFHRYMEKNGIEYTDGGCQYGWLMTNRSISKAEKKVNRYIFFENN